MAAFIEFYAFIIHIHKNIHLFRDITYLQILLNIYIISVSYYMFYKMYHVFHFSIFSKKIHLNKINHYISSLEFLLFLHLRIYAAVKAKVNKHTF